MAPIHLTIGITPGSEQGVGPELLLKALNEFKHDEFVDFIWCGDSSSLMLASARAQLPLEILPNHRAKFLSGLLFSFSEDISGHLPRAASFLKNSVLLAQNNVIEAIVTGPVEKAVLGNIDGISYAGQTEFFSTFLGQGNKAIMAFMGGPFILSLFSIHVALSKVSSCLNEQIFLEHIISIARESEKILTKSKELLQIAILGLNPHAGEQGLLGDEETKIMVPTIKKAKTMGFNVIGPLPADGFFANFHRLKPDQIPDVVIAMYHDQGLIPYKLLTQGQAVNVTLGLKVPRVSPSHGTAQDLVGKNIACLKSAKMAIEVAVKLGFNEPLTF